MSEQTVLVILIAILAFSWVAVAAVCVLVGVRIMRVLDELTLVVKRLRTAGEAAASDIAELRERLKEEGTKLRGMFDFLLGFVSRKRSRKERPDER